VMVMVIAAAAAVVSCALTRSAVACGVPFSTRSSLAYFCVCVCVCVCVNVYVRVCACLVCRCLCGVLALCECATSSVAGSWQSGSDSVSLILRQ
jgi:hypothetical protein